MVPFTGQNIVLTGGGSGIGLRTAIMLAERGATVWIAELSNNPPEMLKALIDQGKVHFRGGISVASREQATKFMDEVLQKAGRLDGLVNNVGISFIEGEIGKDEEYQKMMAVNTGGVWNYGTYALRVMKEQEPRGEWGSRGNIVNLISGAGLGGVSQMAGYCASKHAIVGLTRAWATDFGQYTIRINGASPGVTESEGFLAFKKHCEDNDASETISQLPQSPLKRFGKPIELAKGICFLLSDEASYVHGQILQVDGGSCKIG